MIRSLTIASLCTAAIIAVPALVGAQSAGLESAIRAEILKDPRAADIPAAQIDAMVIALAQTAAAQGVNESDITWKPATRAGGGIPADCGFLCTVNQIFGFGGNDFTVPIGLGVTSALLILFISMMLHRHHVHGVEPTVEAIHLPPKKRA